MGDSLSSINKHDANVYGEILAKEQQHNSIVIEKRTAETKWYSTALKEQVESDPQLSLVRKNIEIIWSKINQARQSYATEDTISALRVEAENLYDEQKKLYDELVVGVKNKAEELFGAEINAAKEAYTQTIQTKTDHESALFSAITAELLELGGISEAQAADWVDSNVFIAGNAVSKLRRIGYPPEQLKQDIAELYRYVGGKIGPIEFVLEGRSKRAYARGKTTISIQGNFNKNTLFHECGHLVEHWDSAFWCACSDFIARRATGAPVKLKTLTKLRYAPNERAYPDKFINPYVGKIYESDSTEVVSMGLQCLANPQSLTHLAQHDPDHFKLILGICTRNNASLRTKLDAASVAAAAKSNEQTRYASWQKALAKVSGSAFGKLLDDLNGGYKGFKITAYGRTGALYPVTPPNGERWNASIYFGKVADIRAIAYLLIAHSEGLLLQGMSSAEAQQQAVLLIREGRVPEWFLPENPLPKV